MVNNIFFCNTMPFIVGNTPVKWRRGIKKKSRFAEGGDRTTPHENYRHSLLNLKY